MLSNTNFARKENIHVYSTALTLEWVFCFSLIGFLFDNRPQTSLGEGRLLGVAQGIGIDYQLKRKRQQNAELKEYDLCGM